MGLTACAQKLFPSGQKLQNICHPCMWMFGFPSWPGLCLKSLLTTWCKQQHFLLCLDLPIALGSSLARAEAAVFVPVLFSIFLCLLASGLGGVLKVAPVLRWLDWYNIHLLCPLCLLLFQWTSRHTFFQNVLFWKCSNIQKNRETIINPLWTCSSPDRYHFQGSSMVCILHAEDEGDSTGPTSYTSFILIFILIV